MAAASAALRWGNGTAGRRIGLLGGSFNPAHDGHLFIARLALARLGLDQVWWLVASHNPLKPLAGMAPFEERLARARRFAAGERRVRVTGLERALATRFTADTLHCLARRCPRARFLWLMGADNLAGMHRWRRWPDIFATVPVAVFDRAPYSFSCLASPAARRFRRHRLAARHAAALARRRPPAWVFLAGPRHPASASAIRAGRRCGSAGGEEGGPRDRHGRPMTQLDIAFPPCDEKQAEQPPLAKRQPPQPLPGGAFPALPRGTFDILYADPPWDYKGQLQHAGCGSGDSGGAVRHYPTVTLARLKTLEIPRIAAPDSLLFLWSTNPHLDQAIELGKAWGFAWATVAFVWDKLRVNPGFYTMSQCELCLVFKRGRIPGPRGARNMRQLVATDGGRIPRNRARSAARIEAMFPALRKIELFARGDRQRRMGGMGARSPWHVNIWKGGEKWQDDSAARGQEAEQSFSNILGKHFEGTTFLITDKPQDLADIYGVATTGSRRSRHGVRPDHVIRNGQTGKTVYVEIKRQRAAGNAYERACKFMMPGIIESACKIAQQPDGVIPFWWVFTNGIASDQRYRREILHWFSGIEGHVLLWRNTHDAREVTDHFEHHIRPLIE